MKKILPLVLLFLFAAILDSCRKETVWMNQAQITGYDYSLCPCCGGFFIEIDDEIYRFYELPEDTDLEITVESVFPISVNINWHAMEDACMENIIVLDEIE